ncbi:MAG: hypothetical protein N2Z60_06345, partial [Elusimicrobiales bacterium]|nr:hypothetical protein [Elusimicrobiales bacterium]
MDNKGVGSVGSADIKKTKSDDIKSDSATLVKEQTAVLVEEKFKVDVASIMNQIKNKHSRHIRYVPVLKEMP